MNNAYKFDQVIKNAEAGDKRAVEFIKEMILRAALSKIIPDKDVITIGKCLASIGHDLYRAQAEEN